MSKILIVDDAPENILVLGKFLMRRFEVVIATSGEDALSVAREQSPSLILLDVKMPGMDGYQVLSRLKADPEMRRIPVIFVTADSSARSETEALRSGAADFIHKPVNLDVLESRVSLQLALRDQEQALLELNEALECKVEERTRDLRIAKEEAEAANSAKGHFLRNVSHEMLTPLHQISGLLQLIQMKANHPQVTTWVDQAADSARRLTSMINSVLRVAQLDSQLTATDMAPVDIPALIDTVVGELQEAAAAKQLLLDLRLDPLPDALISDASLIRSALHAYLENAIKFTETGAIEIAVSVCESAEGEVVVRFSVSDTGIGFDQDVQRRLFRLFEQGDNSLTRPFEGAGLGLVTVKKIAERLGGAVGCESTPGEGSRFWFSVRMTGNR
ncbi:response regulator [Thiorhodococcus fuscus]|uniref:histidine kinase n=1 Tax=Thiorhodococcus fuscus TaxID=527200 RepID=A0ABW4Y473_9GAMM